MDRQGPMLRRARGDDGASLVEFALILPLFAMLMLGTLTGGLAYNRKLAITSAAREGVRYAATLPQPATMSSSDWADRVRDVTVASADRELDPSDSGRYICVARVVNLVSFKREYIGSSSNPPAFGECFSDGRPATDNRVQVVARRTSTFEAMVFSRDLELESRGVARYEAPAP